MKTYQNAQEMISDQQEKALKRRGDNDGLLGIQRRRRRPDGSTYLEMRKTPEDILASIREGKRLAGARRGKVLAERLHSTRNAERLKGEGYRIDYDMAADRVTSAAYKWDPEEKEVVAYFATRSPKDNFSKAGARAALVNHLDNNTHRITFKLNNPTKEHIKFLFLQKLNQRIESHPHEFPSNTVKANKSLKNSPLGKIIAGISEMAEQVIKERDK